jgi:hypothetical protein
MESLADVLSTVLADWLVCVLSNVEVLASTALVLMLALSLVI